MWQSLFERNERLKLQRENADMGANAQRNKEEAARLRARLGEERKKAQDAEGNARCVRACVRVWGRSEGQVESQPAARRRECWTLDELAIK